MLLRFHTTDTRMSKKPACRVAACLWAATARSGCKTPFSRATQSLKDGLFEEDLNKGFVTERLVNFNATTRRIWRLWNRLPSFCFEDYVLAPHGVDTTDPKSCLEYLSWRPVHVGHSPQCCSMCASADEHLSFTVKKLSCFAFMSENAINILTEYS